MKMRTVQVSEHIWKLSTRGFPISVWIVKEENGVTLVDTGISMIVRKILSYIDQLQEGSLQKILLTHGHPDHIGGVKKILTNSNVPVYAHKTEIPFIEGEAPYPGKKKAKRFLLKGTLPPLPEKDENLTHISSLHPYLTPGHSPGHVVYHHEKDNVLIAGDLFTSYKGKLKRPIAMFTPDMNQAVKSGEIIKQLQPASLSPCHGRDILKPHTV